MDFTADETFETKDNSGLLKLGFYLSVLTISLSSKVIAEVWGHG